jgi:hypothetical protein
VLTLAYMFSFLDRQIVSMMIGPIKRDFGLSDTPSSSNCVVTLGFKLLS